MSPHPNVWKAYFYPETFDEITGNGTLRNLLGVRDERELARLEYEIVLGREAELELGLTEISRTYDAAHIRAIHSYLFQDVYEWAGCYRTVNISKGMSDFADVESGEIERYLHDVHRLVEATAWSELDRHAFGEQAATVFAYLNQAHPFREGNGRTSKIFMEHVAELSQVPTVVPTSQYRIRSL